MARGIGCRHDADPDAKLNVEPMAWLTDVLERIVSATKAHELHTLLPWHGAADQG